jgi:hypothetical protein
MSIYMFQQAFHARRVSPNTFYNTFPGVVVGADVQRTMLTNFVSLLDCVESSA